MDVGHVWRTLGVTSFSGEVVLLRSSTILGEGRAFLEIGVPLGAVGASGLFADSGDIVELRFFRRTGTTVVTGEISVVGLAFGHTCLVYKAIDLFDGAVLGNSRALQQEGVPLKSSITYSLDTNRLVVVIDWCGRGARITFLQ